MRKIILTVLLGLVFIPTTAAKGVKRPIKAVRERIAINNTVHEVVEVVKSNNAISVSSSCTCENCICENCTCSQKELQTKQEMVYNNVEGCENGSCSSQTFGRTRFFGRFRR